MNTETQTPPTATKPKKSRKWIILILIATVLVLLLCCCVSGLGYAMYNRNKTLKNLDKKISQVTKDFNDPYTGSSGVSGRDTKVKSSMDDNDKKDSELDTWRAGVNQKQSEFLAHNEAFNARSGSSTDTGLVDQVNALVNEENALYNEIVGIVSQYDGLDVAGQSLERQTSTQYDDANGIKEGMEAKRSEYQKELDTIKDKRKKLSIISLNFSKDVDFIEKGLKTIDLSSLDDTYNTLGSKMDAVEGTIKDYGKNIADRDALKQQIQAKIDRITQINQQLDQLWPA
jgi:hypothetical protein